MPFESSPKTKFDFFSFHSSIFAVLSLAYAVCLFYTPVNDLSLRAFHDLDLIRHSFPTYPSQSF